jgi:hypothetical protein
MNIQMRIITEDNIDQVMNMSYSDNISKLLKTGDYKDLPNLYNKYRGKIAEQQREKMVRTRTPTTESDRSIPYAEGSSAYSPAYDPNDSPAYDPNASPTYDPNASPAYNPDYSPHSPEDAPPNFLPDEQLPAAAIEGIKIANEEVKTEFDALPERDKIMLMKIAAEQRAKKNKEGEEKEEVKSDLQTKPQLGGMSTEQITSILRVEEEKPESESLLESSTDSSSSSSGSSGSETKSVSFDTGSSDGVKQIIL